MVHFISIIFSIVHIVPYEAIVYVCLYFGAVIWAWAWLIIDKWPPEERAFNPFMSITLMHAVSNGLALAMTPLLHIFG